MLLSDQVLLVTGGASGIGAATATLGAREGATVVLADRDEEGLQAVSQRLRDEGARVAVAVADVLSEEGAEAGVEVALKDFGRLDGAVNCAGILGAFAPLGAVDLMEWRRVLAVDLDALFLCVRAQVRAMAAADGGAIVNLASGAGITGAPRSAAYAAAKHGVVGLTRSVCREYVAEGIRVNAVCPSMIETPMLEDFLTNTLGADSRKRIEQRQPQGRFGRADEVAEVVVWLLSSRASFVNGVALPVDGGLDAASS